MRVRVTCLAVVSMLLAGCASFSADGGFGPVARLTEARTGVTPVYQRGDAPDAATQSRVAVLLAGPLSADGAVELALLQHRGLQAAFAELGIAEADWVQAGRLRGPTFSFGRLGSGGGREIDRALMFDVLGVLTLPLARDLARSRLQQVQLQAAQEAVTVAAEARQAYFHAVAAQQIELYQAQVRDAADAASELAQRMRVAGNVSPLAQMREQAFQAESTAGWVRAQHDTVAQRERLLRALGLADPTQLRLPERLPDLPAALAELPAVEQQALDHRLDLQQARRDTDSLAQALGLGRATRFVNVLHAGYQNASHSGEARRNGYEVEVSLPWFDGGGARVARAEASYQQAVHRTAQLALQARSEVREAYAAYRSAYALARHYQDEVVPLQQRIGEQNLRRYNGMLIGVFDLLAGAREQARSVTAALEAQRDLWIADTRLRLAMNGRTPLGGEPSTPAARRDAAGTSVPAAH